jgi:hypothetical protein
MSAQPLIERQQFTRTTDPPAPRHGGASSPRHNAGIS